MPRRSHILVPGYLLAENFATKKTGRSPSVPIRNRGEHGQRLLQEYLGSLNVNDQNKGNEYSPISEETGIYIEISSFEDCELPLKSLDTQDFRLQSLHKINNVEVAVIFVPDSKRNKLQNKLIAYLGPDNRFGTPNRALIDSIATIRLANLKSFWTDKAELFPQDANQQFWWEVWLTNLEAHNLEILLTALSERLGIEAGQSSLVFFKNRVVVVKATINQLEAAVELISCLSELRKARETPSVYVGMNPKEQAEWVDNLIQRFEFVEGGPKATVSILDTGVNFDHPLLSLVCDNDKSVCWNPAWPKYEISYADAWKHHASLQAGLVMFGDLLEVLLSNAPVQISYQIESGRILPPNGINPPELYGAITTDTALKLEIGNVNTRRVYSLAVTASNDGIGGAPSSWSSEIDSFTSGFNDGQKRLFIISAGNNRALHTNSSFWDQGTLAEIEDPAQSWNAITVGAYTTLTTNNDPNFLGWLPAVVQGDLSPGSRTSVNWGWGKQAPFKPDVVEEGGNKLVSPGSVEVSDADTVSLLTTSGRSNGALFDTTRDTSAACALVSRIAALLLSEYSDFTNETVRGLIIHSAEWTSYMLTRKQNLELIYLPQTVNKIMLRTFGFGVPSLEKARYSADNLLTLVAQNQIQPFCKPDDAPASSDAKLNQIHLYNLPWPREVLQSLPGDMIVKLKITLSYFIEPNPGRRGYRDRFSYQSHGLRFDVKRPAQSIENFKALLNKLSVTDDYVGPEGSDAGWMLGTQLRTRGSIHSDTWTGVAADLADMDAIAIYPVGGWWKSRSSEGRWGKSVDYSLIVSIEVPDETVDIYSDIETMIQNNIELEVEI